MLRRRRPKGLDYLLKMRHRHRVVVSVIFLRVAVIAVALVIWFSTQKPITHHTIAAWLAVDLAGRLAPWMDGWLG